MRSPVGFTSLSGGYSPARVWPERVVLLVGGADPVGRLLQLVRLLGPATARQRASASLVMAANRARFLGVRIHVAGRSCGPPAARAAWPADEPGRPRPAAPG